MDRRSFLGVAGAGGVAGAVVGWLGYEGFRRSGREGRVFWRQMAVDAGGEPGSLVVMTEVLEDGSAERTYHPDYRDSFEDEGHVPEPLHRKLGRRYGDDEPYYLIRYDEADCNGVPGDEGGNALEVSRTEFNRIRVGDCVKM